jgi:hypothetical protein
MKRLAVILIVLFTAATLFAGGKECEAKGAKAAKSVELSGTLASTGSGDAVKTVFRTAEGDTTYTVCEQTKASVLKVTGAVRVKGKIVKCSGHEELVIESAKKI